MAARLQSEGILDPKVLRVDTNTLLYQVPGGMLSNLISQLKQAGREDRVLRCAGGDSPGSQGLRISAAGDAHQPDCGHAGGDERHRGRTYKTFPKESKALLRGEYGALPGEVNPEVRALAGIAPEEVITCRPADRIAPELEGYRAEFRDIAKSEEDVLSLALFPQVAPKFLAWRDGEGKEAAAPETAAKPAAPEGVRELFVEYKF